MSHRDLYPLYMGMEGRKTCYTNGSRGASLGVPGPRGTTSVWGKGGGLPLDLGVKPEQVDQYLQALFFRDGSLALALKQVSYRTAVPGHWLRRAQQPLKLLLFSLPGQGWRQGEAE